MTAPLYTGNIPSNVSKDAKYSIVHGAAGMEVRLVVQLSGGERALVTTRAHPRLVKMVNSLKEEQGGVSGGAFYINEYSLVLVPVGGSCYCAGEYGELLEFAFEDRIITPKAPTGLRPGDEWPGSHVGVAYTLTADGQDVRYVAVPRPNVEKTVRLSEEAGTAGARRLARRLFKHKPGGGRIYINEAREFFGPTQTGNGAKWIYLGNLEEDEWFPRPTILKGRG
jgi:hypothetical protein